MRLRFLALLLLLLPALPAGERMRIHRGSRGEKGATVDGGVAWGAHLQVHASRRDSRRVRRTPPPSAPCLLFPFPSGAPGVTAEDESPRLPRLMREGQGGRQGLGPHAGGWSHMAASAWDPAGNEAT